MECLGWRRSLKRVRRQGCLQTAGIAVFAVLLGAFAASTILRHSEGRREAPATQGVEPASEAAPVARARIRVEVRNGSGVRGAAERVTSHLRREGFDVVDFGNADRFDHERTIVIDRSGNPLFTREVAVALQDVPIASRLDSSLYLDVTVMIGADLPEILDDEEAERPAWRRWFDRIPRPWD
jgi:hypothetical protein